MNYILDTDTLIDYTKNRGNARTQINSMIEEGHSLMLCAITVAEVYSGFSEKDRVNWLEFISSLPYVAITQNVAIAAGIDRYTVARSGKTLSVTDAIIGALAREHDATVLTSNTKDFPMNDVTVRSLRSNLDR